MPARQYWLFKTEPDAYSIDDLAAEPAATTMWDGIRNYQARNLLRDEVKKGDGVLVYHSQTKEKGIVGTARVVKAAYPDPTQFEPRSSYHDARSDPDDPRWITVDIQLDRAFDRVVSLAELREEKSLSEMLLLKRGMRLSIQPVRPAEWKLILQLARRK